MSNFTCKECGTTHLDLGAGIGYRTTDDVNLIKINAIMAKNLEIAIEALKLYAYGQIESVEENIDGEDEVVTYPYSNDDGEAAKEALMKMQSVKGLTK